ncbi:hypothetical protein RhiirA4_468656 [Rhizophagus irregularis]|uniref:SbsA Ig-like domain-containing protein n=1 Tax=Rhizophagus irregularis TaxID=588596 RepID=A0A2I1GY45_9GLOM|nr:hypothetical protein RhiirA4_468656 [Rhizophagus irregularis]
MEKNSRNIIFCIKSTIYLFILYSIFFSFALADSVFEYSDPGLEVKSAKTFEDSSILLHMNMRIQKPLDDSSLDDHFIIRILDSNSEIHQIEIFDEKIKEAENIFILTNEYILLTYYKINDTTRYGMICNRKGEILTKTKDLDLGGSKVSSFSNVIVNINPEISFLWLTGNYDSPNGINTISWKIFSMPTSDENIIDKNITQLGSDSISSKGEEWGEYKGFPTIDGGYGISLIAHHIQPSISAVDNETLSLKPEWLIYVTFLKYQTYERMELFQIYQTNSNLNITTMKFRECNLAFDNGYICIISASSSSPAKSGEFIISFLSSGAVIEKGISQFIIDNQIPSGRQYNINGVVSLVYGGFAIILQNTNYESNICYSPDGRHPFTNCENLPIMFQKGENGLLIYGLLSNNSLWIIQNEISLGKWSIYSFDLKQFVKDVHGYGNPYIESTLPPLDSEIYLGTKEISINFNNPIALSSNDISIYQVNQTQDIIRQRISAKNLEFIHLSNNNLTINIKVLSSTFNMQKTYYVLMDNNFVKNLTNNEPKIGIKKNKWNFTAIQLTEPKHAESAIVSIGLNEDCSRIFDNFTLQERSDFFVNFQNKLRQILPDSENQLTFTGKYRKDSSNSQIQLALNIKKKGKASRNVKSIIDDLDTLIRNKEITQISMVEPTVYLDKEYGCKIEYLTQLIIQVLYFKRTIAWNITPLLSLISNGFIIIMDIYEYWFEIYHRIQRNCKNENSSNNSTKLGEELTKTSLEITPTNSIPIVDKEIAKNDDIEKDDITNVNEISPVEEIINYEQEYK